MLRLHLRLCSVPEDEMTTLETHVLLLRVIIIIES